MDAENKITYSNNELDSIKKVIENMSQVHHIKIANILYRRFMKSSEFKL